MIKTHSKPKWICEIRDRVDHASHGPWYVEEISHPISKTSEGGNCILRSASGRYVASSFATVDRQDRHNLEFSAHARDDVPRLLDMVTEMVGILGYAESCLLNQSDSSPDIVYLRGRVANMLQKYREG